MTVQFRNHAETTLASAFAASATELTVALGDGREFPTNLSDDNPCYIALEDTNNNYEVLRCTARTADTITVERGRDGTTPRDWSAGDTVFMPPLAGALEEMQSLTGRVVETDIADSLKSDLVKNVSYVESNNEIVVTDLNNSDESHPLPDWQTDVEVQTTVSAATTLLDQHLDNLREAVEDRLEDLEDQESDFQRRMVYANRAQIDYTSPNTWVAIPGAVLPAATASARVEVLTEAANIDEGRWQGKRTVLDGGPQSYTNGGGPSNDNNRYQVRMNGAQGEFHSDTADTFFLTFVEFEPDATARVRIGANLSRDAQGRIQADAQEGEGVTSATAGDGLDEASGVLSVKARNGVEVVGDFVQLRLDGNTIDQSALGAKVGGKSIGPAQIVAAEPDRKRNRERRHHERRIS